VDDPVSAENAREGEGNVFESILTSERGAEGDDFFLIVFDDIDDVGECGADAVVCCALTFDDFVGIFASFF